MAVRPGSSALTTDLYELTMSAAFFAHGKTERATFEMFVRDLPPGRGYLLACGLEQVVDYLLSLRFSGEDIDYLRKLPVFVHTPGGFWEYLRGLRFTGELRAVPEGTPVTTQEPILQVTAPLIEAQIIESWLLAAVNHQTLIATKAARVVDAAEGRPVADFGLRRAHGTDAGFWAARASYIAGCSGTSNVDAARELGIPPLGTAAHSFTLAFGDEETAFQAFADTFPDTTILLIDTFDTLEGARRAVKFGNQLKGVRLDSGDIIELSRQVRKILDENGCPNAKIMASSNLNEYKIRDIVASGAPVDMFGVGTEMITSYDAPALAGVYKLVAIEEDGRLVPRAKRSAGKKMYPGKKQIFRPTGLLDGDLLALDTESVPPGTVPLLETVISDGCRVQESPSLDEIRTIASKQRKRLPDKVRQLVLPTILPVTPSAELVREAERLRLVREAERLRNEEGGE